MLALLAPQRPIRASELQITEPPNYNSPRPQPPFLDQRDQLTPSVGAGAMEAIEANLPRAVIGRSSNAGTGSDAVTAALFQDVPSSGLAR